MKTLSGLGQRIPLWGDHLFGNPIESRGRNREIDLVPLLREKSGRLFCPDLFPSFRGLVPARAPFPALRPRR
ncbi:MAG: hypothetical protein D084_Lepto4C00524G0004 [Leptospirillum sp. Group IV 'UBA BS']|nr:MAG: hypothetical protein D084_Lepto4C00524G0004 [Leptospirillum sp. Group IV 'UBA BS']MCL5284299.1 hypothetical protein [Nitrospirota bacterium]